MKIIGRDVMLGEGVTLVFCCKSDDEPEKAPHRMAVFYRAGELLKWGPVRGAVEDVDSRVDDQRQLPAFIRSERDFLDFIALFASMLGLTVKRSETTYSKGPAYTLVRL